MIPYQSKALNSIRNKTQI
ncbi:hypothetical protein CXB51_028249 [Gossypium anomalum]|uniref:Uncharacterized protein n=1 Tax=Gossypium anomalum TaxID=47600 RepID=A0A8J6CPF2_9ROSI|nr:hypothetical protein CXB51_028249 [Gossypium anomalum]